MPEPGDLAVANGDGGEEREVLGEQVRALLAGGEAHAALHEADSALKRFRVAGDKRGEAAAYLMQALVRSSVEDLEPEETMEAARVAAAAMRDAGDVPGELEALRLLSALQAKWQQFDAARKTAKTTVELCEKTGSDAEVASAYFAFAEAHLACGDTGEATKAVRQAAAAFERDADDAGQAQCQLLLGRISREAGDLEDAVEAAQKARKMFENQGSKGGQAAALFMISTAQMQDRRHVEALRAAEEAGRLWRAAGDVTSEVDALVAQAEAKVNICDERPSTSYASCCTILKAAELALSAARARKPHDRECIATALLTYARALLKSNALKGAWISAKGAARTFRKAGNNVGRARALVVWAAADLEQGYLNEARGNAQAAIAVFEQADNVDGKQQALELCDRIDRAQGIPTEAELQEQARIEFMMQQQMLMQQQQQFQAMPQQQAQMMYQPGAPQDTQLAAAAPKAGGFTRDGASPLKLSAGIDPSIVRSKIFDLAGQIIGDTEDLDGDTPLMEAGLTSNTAVILRDELAKDLPGVKLPPTLIFDYPSVGAIADFVVESSANL